MAVTRRLLLTAVAIEMVAVTSNTSPMRISAQVWVFIAPVVSLLFHFLIEPNLDPTMATTRPLEMGAVANPTIATLSGLC